MLSRYKLINVAFTRSILLIITTVLEITYQIAEPRPNKFFQITFAFVTAILLASLIFILVKLLRENKEQRLIIYSFTAYGTLLMVATSINLLFKLSPIGPTNMVTGVCMFLVVINLTIQSLRIKRSPISPYFGWITTEILLYYLIKMFMPVILVMIFHVSNDFMSKSISAKILWSVPNLAILAIPMTLLGLLRKLQVLLASPIAT